MFVVICTEKYEFYIFMKRTIIYVFGPKRLSKKYYSNGEMILEEGGWLKIGKTSDEYINANKWDIA